MIPSLRTAALALLLVVAGAGCTRLGCALARGDVDAVLRAVEEGRATSLRPTGAHDEDAVAAFVVAQGTPAQLERYEESVLRAGRPAEQRALFRQLAVRGFAAPCARLQDVLAGARVDDRALPLVVQAFARGDPGACPPAWDHGASVDVNAHRLALARRALPPGSPYLAAFAADVARGRTIVELQRAKDALDDLRTATSSDETRAARAALGDALGALQALGVDDEAVREVARDALALARGDADDECSAARAGALRACVALCSDGKYAMLDVIEPDECDVFCALRGDDARARCLVAAAAPP